jgi:hypothetical protein
VVARKKGNLCHCHLGLEILLGSAKKTFPLCQGICQFSKIILYPLGHGLLDPFGPWENLSKLREPGTTGKAARNNREFSAKKVKNKRESTLACYFISALSG